MTAKEIKLLIYESFDNNLITEQEKSDLLEQLTLKLLYEEVMLEAGGNIVNVVKDKTEKIANSKVGQKYMSALDKGAEFAANKVVKAPEKGASPEIYKEYEKKLKQWKVRFKIAEIIATGTIAVGPVGWLVSAMNAVTIANDPDTKELLDKAKDKGQALLSKIKDINEKLKKGQLSESKLNSEVNAITTAGAAVAKQADSAAKRSKPKTAMAAEGVCNVLDGYVLENGEVTDEGFGILNMLIEKTDFSERPEMFDVICHYCGV